MTGTNALSLIAVERHEQVNKHGYSAEHDDQLTNDELTEAAVAILTEDPEHWPAKLPQSIFWNASEKGEAERRVVAAALLAADIDRILRDRERVGPPPELTAGGEARVHPHAHDHCQDHGMSSWDMNRAFTLRNQRCTVISIDAKRGEATVQPVGLSGTLVLPIAALIPLQPATQPA